MRQTYAFLLAVLLAVGCGGRVWDLDQPIYIDVATDTPKAAMFALGLRHAIEATGGTVSPSRVAQRIFLIRGNDKDCKVGTVAYTNTSPGKWNEVGICDSQALLNFSQAYADVNTGHEWLHVAAGRSDHLPCESRAVMAAYSDCHGLVPFQPLDFAYLCSTGNVHGGRCLGTPCPSLAP